MGAGFSVLSGCSLASDSQIDELIAAEITEAVAQAQGFEIKESK